MPTPEEIAQANKERANKENAVKTAILNESGLFQGYQFQKDSMANKMAFLFGGEEGEKEAKRIFDEAAKKEDPKEKQQFIEQQVAARAKGVDQKFQAGIKTVFDDLKKLESSASGEEAKKDAVVNLMQGLGLNVNPDNVQTNYDPGPPQVFVITWVNRPTENVAKPDSHINKLANAYASTLENKQDFQAAWDQNVAHAKEGGPKIPKEAFMKSAEATFKEKLAESHKTAADSKSRMGSYQAALKQARGGATEEEEHHDATSTYKMPK